MPEICIIIVTFNAAETLQQCLNSIYQQPFKKIKIIVIDGKSSDDTVKLLHKNSGNLFYWKSEPDGGIYHAMNKALMHVTGDWIYFLGADDQLLPEFALFAKSLKDNNSIYYANVLAGDYKKPGHLSCYQIAKFGIYHQAMIFPAAIFRDFKYDLQYKISADYALILNLAGAGVKFIYRDYTIANFNDTGISAKMQDSTFLKHKANLILKNFGLLIWMRYNIHTYKRNHSLTN